MSFSLCLTLNDERKLEENGCMFSIINKRLNKFK